MTDLPPGLDELPAERQAEILARRLHRAEAALREAESALEGRMRALDKANRDLTLREEELVRRLDIESRQLLSAQRTAGIASIYAAPGEPVAASPQLASILGLPADQPVSPESVLTVVYPLDRARILAASNAFYSTMAANTDHIFDHRITTKAGEIRWLRWALRRVPDLNSGKYEVFGTVRDITETRKNERNVRAHQLLAERRVKTLDRMMLQLEQANREVEAAMRVRTRFLSAMGHQIRTPLNALSGTLALIAGSDLDAENRERLEMAMRANDVLTSLLDDMIEGGDTDASSIELTKAPVDLSAAIDQTATYWQLSAKGERIVTHVSSDVPEYVLADPVRLRELFDLLIPLALEGTGTVRLSADRSGSGEVLLSFQSGVDWNLLREQQQTGGMSTGLRVAERIVTAMSGTLAVDEGDAGKLSVRVPMPRTNAPSAAPVERLRTSDGEAPLILVAEDTESNRYVITGLLTSFGCRSRTVENGAEALAAVEEEQFDAILMDVQMPIMSGEEATRQIRASQGPEARTPIIGVTAHSLQSERDRLLASGMSACLSKPVRPNELKAALKTAFAARSEARGDTALFDMEAFRLAFVSLPAAYRERFLDAAVKDVRDYSRDLTLAAEQGDEEGARRAAHSLKAVSVNIGAVAILERIAEFRGSDFTDRSSTVPALNAAVADTLSACGDLFRSTINNQ